jgi:hypothetical protein
MGHDKTSCNVRIGELLDQVRQYYVDRLIKIRDGLLVEQNTRLILEPELRGSDGVVVTEGVLQLPLRTDTAVIKDGGAKTLSIDTERMLSFDPISFMWGAGLKVRLGPFQWQAMRLQVPCRKRRAGSRCSTGSGAGSRRTRASTMRLSRGPCTSSPILKSQTAWSRSRSTSAPRQTPPAPRRD